MWESVAQGEGGDTGEEKQGKAGVRGAGGLPAPGGRGHTESVWNSHEELDEQTNSRPGRNRARPEVKWDRCPSLPPPHGRQGCCNGQGWPSSSSVHLHIKGYDVH